MKAESIIDRIIYLENKLETLNKEFNKEVAQNISDRIVIKELREWLFSERDASLRVKLERIRVKVSTFLVRRRDHLIWAIFDRRKFLRRLNDGGGSKE
jgi:hypothetical protein